MTKKGRDQEKSCQFSITAPPQADPGKPGDCVCVADNGSVAVSVDGNVDCGGFTATISGSGVATSAVLAQASDTVWSGSLGVGVFTDTAPGVGNRTVTVTTGTGASQSLSFRAVHPASCSGSTSDDESAMAALGASLQEGRPAPVAVTAEFGAPHKGGGARVEAATLVYSGAPGFERCWLSQPIDQCSDGVDAALWMLERPDARTWLLRLRRGGFDLVVYSHTSAAERDGSLPVRLHVERDGNGVTEWPLTVTISPAP